MLVEIVYTRSGRGLQRDAELLSQMFESLGHTVHQQPAQPTSPIKLWLERKWYRAVETLLPPTFRSYALAIQRQLRLFINGKSSYNLVVHLQSIQHRHLHSNCSQWLIPNQEWFSASQLHYLQAIDTVVCKTREAVNLFSAFHSNVQFSGFSSPLLANPPTIPAKDLRKALHVAGNSSFKGTQTLIKVWRTHPEWPRLTLVCNQPPDDTELPANIKVLSNLSHGELEQLWLTTGIAIQPSEVEGFGQILVEAQAYGCVVLTTDAPPMNEVVNSEFGILVPYNSTGAFRMGTRYYVDANQLESAIQELLSAPEQELQSMSANATRHACSNHMAFTQQIENLITSPEVAPYI